MSDYKGYCKYCCYSSFNSSDEEKAICYCWLRMKEMPFEDVCQDFDAEAMKINYYDTTERLMLK